MRSQRSSPPPPLKSPRSRAKYPTREFNYTLIIQFQVHEFKKTGSSRSQSEITISEMSEGTAEDTSRVTATSLRAFLVLIDIIKQLSK